MYESTTRSSSPDFSKFQKFDGGKLRFELVDSEFSRKLMSLSKPLPTDNLKKCMFTWMKQYSTDAMNQLIGECLALYHSRPAMDEGLARVITYGATKYKPNNWRKCEEPERYEGAIFRHLSEIELGNPVDDESGLNHLDHIATNIMMLSVLTKKL